MVKLTWVVLAAVLACFAQISAIAVGKWVCRRAVQRVPRAEMSAGLSADAKAGGPAGRLVLLRDGQRLRDLYAAELVAQHKASGLTEMDDGSGRVWLASCGNNFNTSKPTHAVEKSCELLISGCNTPSELIRGVEDLRLDCSDGGGWAIKLETVAPFQDESGRPRPEAKPLLMALAQHIRGQPALSPSTAKITFSLVETARGYFFAREMQASPPLLPAAVATSWRLRGFQFSAALSLEAAVSALSVLTALAPAPPPASPLVFLDACCGTGTSLVAAALVLAPTSSLALVGCDVNDDFVKGCRDNLAKLQSVCPPPWRHTEARIFRRDAAEAPLHANGKDDWPDKIDVASLNLPWGEAVNENSFGDAARIISRVAKSLRVGGMLCIWSREARDAGELRDAGLELLQCVALDGEAVDSRKRRAGRCVVHFATRVH